MIARDLSRTRSELLTSISSHELQEAKILYKVESDERKEQSN